jgi:hypothetical protein
LSRAPPRARTSSGPYTCTDACDASTSSSHSSSDLSRNQKMSVHAWTDVSIALPWTAAGLAHQHQRRRRLPREGSPEQRHGLKQALKRELVLLAASTILHRIWICFMNLGDQTRASVLAMTPLPLSPLSSAQIECRVGPNNEGVPTCSLPRHESEYLRGNLGDRREFHF